MIRSVALLQPSPLSHRSRACAGPSAMQMPRSQNRAPPARDCHSARRFTPRRGETPPHVLFAAASSAAGHLGAALTRLTQTDRDGLLAVARAPPLPATAAAQPTPLVLVHRLLHLASCG